jgi:site-specific recombinase XerD
MPCAGTKLDVVRQVLGHSSLATSSIYAALARDVMDKELQEHALSRTMRHGGSATF